ncbi:unnamed protein product [Peniophora sp. CBMAI 1063]|nr:unnamed protein product [Peniophora sp. CBMAI 1063]
MPKLQPYPQAYAMDTSPGAAVYASEFGVKNVVVYSGVDYLRQCTHIEAILSLQDADGGFAVRYGSEEEAQRALTVHHSRHGIYEVVDITMPDVNAAARGEITNERLKKLKARLIDGPAPALIPIDPPNLTPYTDTASLLTHLAPPSPFSMPSTPSKASGNSNSIAARFEQAGTPRSRRSPNLSALAKLPGSPIRLTSGPDCYCLTPAAVASADGRRKGLQYTDNWRPPTDWSPTPLTPPSDASPNWMPRNGPGEGPWHLVRVGRTPGIYASLEDAHNANRSGGGYFRSSEFDSFELAVADWVSRCKTAGFAIITDHAH